MATQASEAYFFKITIQRPDKLFIESILVHTCAKKTHTL
uniref:Uncharacterized protein n=1 Tax=Anguilla anguilla TaxID=7936 RepID=A0A0E9VYC9_ANGAN